MPEVSEIVDVTITVQSIGITRQGFNSLICVGDDTALGTATEYEVRKYTSFEQFNSDVTDGVWAPGTTLVDLVTVAFAQSPSVPEVYVSAVNDTTIDASDLSAIQANNNDWFGYCHVYEGASNNKNASDWIAAADKYGFFLQTDTADQLLNSTFSCIWYTESGFSGTARYVQAAIASRILALIPGSYTAAYKQLNLVSAATDLSTTDESTLRTNNVNQFTAIAGVNLTYDGVTTAGGFIDTYIGVLYLKARIAEDVFAQIASVEKVPYTNAGINLVVSAVQNRLQQSITEGYLTDDPEPVVEAPLASEVSDTDKSNRLLPDVRFAAVTAGAIHTVKINGTIIA